MRDLPIMEGEEEYVRRDPVTGRRVIVFRRRHDFTRSPKLEAFRRCTGDMLRGGHYRGHGAQKDSIMVREGLAMAAHECSRLVAAAPGDRGEGR